MYIPRCRLLVYTETPANGFFQKVYFYIPKVQTFSIICNSFDLITKHVIDVVLVYTVTAANGFFQ